MDKIEEKMARFVELSKKFTIPEEGVKEICDLKDIMEPEETSGITLPSPGRFSSSTSDGYLTINDTSEEVKIKSDRERLEDGVTRRWNVWEEYKEYLQLQKDLSEYFEAKKKL